MFTRWLSTKEATEFPPDYEFCLFSVPYLNYPCFGYRRDGCWYDLTNYDRDGQTEFYPDDSVVYFARVLNRRLPNGIELDWGT